MRLLKPALLGLSGILIVILAISALLPNHVMTTKWVKVHAPKDSIVSMVSDLKSWPAWNGLLSNATDIKVKDSVLSWNSASQQTPNNVTIKGVTPMGVSTEMSINNAKPFRSGFSIEQKDPAIDSVQVVWFIVEELKWYPWEKFYGMMAAEVKGPLMQQSLDRLKSKLESE